MAENPKIKKIKLGETTYDLQATDTNVVLESDLYTYTPIGMAQKATNGNVTSTGSAISNKNPGKIGAAGDTLKDVFSAIFGEAQDEEPSSITDTRGISYTYDPSATLGSKNTEVGTSISDTFIEVTVTASGTCTSTYGYYTAVDATGKPSTIVYGSGKSLAYAVSEQTISDNKYKLKLTLPINYYESGTSGTTTVTLNQTPVYVDGKDVYINATSVTVTVPNSITKQTASDQSIYGSIKASCMFDKLKDSNGTEVLGFLTYQKNAAAPTAKITNALNTKSITDKNSTALAVNAGKCFVYYAITDSGTAVPSSWTPYGTGQTDVTGLEFSSVAAGKYIWVASATKYNYLRLWNGVIKDYNSTDENCYTNHETPGSITNSLSVTVDGYYFQATGPRQATGDVKLKLSDS